MKRAPAATHQNPLVDAYIDRAKPFAVPILLHVRALIHKACPQVEESIKWSRPFFSCHDTILCNLSAFTHHCSVGFWGVEMADVLREAHALQPGAMGSLGRITSLADLPSDKLLLGWLKQAVAFIDAGTYTSPIKARREVVKAPRAGDKGPAAPAAPSTDDFLAALARNRHASTFYARLKPQRQTRISRVDHHGKASPDARGACRHIRHLAGRGQEAPLEIRDTLSAIP